jgi:predicted aconitase with swiveling domain
VDPVGGVVSDPRHPEHGLSVAGTVLVIPASIGSSSSSAIMLELMRERTTPAAILIGEADAILSLGVIVGIELGYPAVPIIELDPAELAGIPEGAILTVDQEGRVALAGGG